MGLRGRMPAEELAELRRLAAACLADDLGLVAVLAAPRASPVLAAAFAYTPPPVDTPDHPLALRALTTTVSCLTISSKIILRPW